MAHFQFLYTIIDSTIQNPALLALVIMLGVFALEDPTTVVVGMLAAGGFIPVPLALGALYARIVFGDIVLYGIGYAASAHPRLGRFIDHNAIAPFRTWLETRYIITIFSARFVPFGRFPTYTSSGFFRSPLGTFIVVVTVAASIWTTALFAAAYWFSSLTANLLEPVRWAIAIFVLVILFLVSRHNVLGSRSTPATEVTRLDTSDDTHTR